MSWQTLTPQMRGLIALRAVAENGTFTRAAQALGWTQPSVSKHLMALEDTLGTRLLRRDRSGSELTDDGARILGLAVRITDTYAQLRETAAGGRERSAAAAPPLRIVVSPTLGSHWLPGALAGLRDHSPERPINTAILRGRQGLREVAQGSA
ncbi:MAG TPA: LysR family transcriptional regulator, partial [Gammaproteobacteria bacterium]|nr:LysR family transcriptional regulator [Gammaproteobacteria bacterium]